MSSTPGHRSSTGSGLGISFPTLSPPTVNTAQVSTGFSASSASGPSTPSRAVASGTATSPSPSRPQQTASPTPTRTSPNRPTNPRSGQQLFQPAFSLRPTHHRSTSVKNFASFSALPPSPGALSPSRARLDAPHSRGGSVNSKTNSSMSDHWQAGAREGGARAESEIMPPETAGGVGRSVSGASTSTSASRVRKKRSSDLIRRLSKSHDTIAGAKYVPLSGNDGDEYPRHGAGPASTRQVTPSGSTSGRVEHLAPHESKRKRSETVSTASANPAQSPQDFDPTPTDSYSSFLQSAFPAPPAHGSPGHHIHLGPALHGTVPRSASQPIDLYGAHYADQPHPRTAAPARDDEEYVKRISDPVTGIHSQNYALIAAEKGGKFLAYSADRGWSANSLNATPRPHSPVHAPLAPDFAHSQSHSHSHPQRHETMGGPGPRSAESAEADPLRQRPWSDSTMSVHRPTHQRSLSEGAVLARQGTLLHPQSGSQRASQELGIMLGNKSRRLSNNQGKLLPPPDLDGWHAAGGAVRTPPVKLEAARKRRARVEVDVVLERECVVEGGEVRGRLEIRVNGEKRDGLRLGGGKVRAVGYEDISSSSRHIFYHHPCPLPAFAHPPLPNVRPISLFASTPDSEGYREAAPGVHFIPFCMRLPLSGGAKGSYTTPSGRGPAVRYVIVGSVKLLMPRTGKRSIAHFYRPIVILPYLNPGIVLAPDEESVEVVERRGLGWSLGGAKGTVELRIALGRSVWVSGQRVWCEIGVKNESTKRIKTLTLALLQTVQTFLPENHKAAVSTDKDGIPNADEALGIASTVRRKIAEEVLEADDVSYGAGRVTGKRWWTGVEAGEIGGWDLSLLIPNGLISIPRSRLIEVSYTLRLTANSSIYVDIPITLINFLSIDPPPMPGDGARMGTSSKASVSLLDGQTYSAGVASTVPHGVYGTHRAGSVLSGESAVGAARASSTTLHIDALLSAGRARAEMEAALHYQDVIPRGARPMSMGSMYTPEGPAGRSQFGTPAHGVPSASSPPPLPGGTGATPMRPKNARLMSYLSIQSSTADQPISEEGDEEEEDEQDKALLAAARLEGRKMSLAALTRAANREKDEYMREGERDLASPSSGQHAESPPPGAWMPAETPYEEVFRVLGDTPSMAGGSEAAGHSPAPVPTTPGSARQAGTEGLHRDPEAGRDAQSAHELTAATAEFDEATIGRLQHMTIAEEQAGLASTRESWSSDQDHQDQQNHHQALHLDGTGNGYGDGEMKPFDASLPNPFGDYGTLEIGKRSHESIPEEEEEEEEDETEFQAGDQTVLDDLVAPAGGMNDDDTLRMILPPSTGQPAELEPTSAMESAGDSLTSLSLSGTGYTTSSKRVPSRSGSALDPHVLLSVNSEREAHIQASRSIYGSWAASAVSEQESEVGQVVEAVKRNLSVKTPSRVMKLDGSHADGADEDNDCEEDRDKLSPTRTRGYGGGGRSGSAPYLTGGTGERKSSHTPSPEKRHPSGLDKLSVHSTGRYASAPNVHGLPMRRESSTPSAPSPLREESKPPTEPLRPAPGRPFANRPSFSFAPSPGTLRVQVPDTSLSPRGGSAFSYAPLSPGPSPRSKYPSQLSASGPGSAGEPMIRGLSPQTSSLRNHITRPPSESASSAAEDAIPPLAPSVASDSASEEGHEQLESPPIASLPTATEHIEAPSPKGAQPMDGRKGSKKEFAPVLDPNWIPGEHLLHTQVAYARTSFSAPDQHAHYLDQTRTAAAEAGRSAETVLGAQHGDARGPIGYPRESGVFNVDVFGHPTSPTSSSHSDHSVVLTGMQSRLRQLDARTEALRKFSVASAASASGSFDAASGGDRVPSLPTMPDYRVHGSGQYSAAGVRDRTPSNSSLGRTQQLRQPSWGSRDLESDADQYREQEPMRLPSAPVPAQEVKEEKVIRKRRSYTAALAPRPARSASDDICDRVADPASLSRTSDHAYPIRPKHSHTQSQSSLGSLGGTTYVLKRTYGGSPPPMDDPANPGYFPIAAAGWTTTSPPPQIEMNLNFSSPPSRVVPAGDLRRNMSSSSVSTTATSLEAALLRRPMGPRSPASASQAGVPSPSISPAPALSVDNGATLNQEDINPYPSQAAYTSPSKSSGKGEAKRKNGPPPVHHYETPGFEVYGGSPSSPVKSAGQSGGLGSIGRSRSGYLTPGGEMTYSADMYGSEAGSVASRNGVSHSSGLRTEWVPPGFNWGARGSQGTDTSEGLL